MPKKEDSERKLSELVREVRERFRGLLGEPLPPEMIKLLDELDRATKESSGDVSRGKDDE